MEILNVKVYHCFPQFGTLCNTVFITPSKHDYEGDPTGKATLHPELQGEIARHSASYLPW